MKLVRSGLTSIRLAQWCHRCSSGSVINHKPANDKEEINAQHAIVREEYYEPISSSKLKNICAK